MPDLEDFTKPTLRLGIDLDGTKIMLIGLDDSGNELLRRRVAQPRLYAKVLAHWGPYFFSDPAQLRTQLHRNQHGDSSGVRGAAWLWGPDHSGCAANPARGL